MLNRQSCFYGSSFAQAPPHCLGTGFGSAKPISHCNRNRSSLSVRRFWGLVQELANSGQGWGKTLELASGVSDSSPSLLQTRALRHAPPPPPEVKGLTQGPC